MENGEWRLEIGIVTGPELGEAHEFAYGGVKHSADEADEPDALHPERQPAPGRRRGPGGGSGRAT